MVRSTRRLKILVGECQESRATIIEKSGIPARHLGAASYTQMIEELRAITPDLTKANMRIEDDVQVIFGDSALLILYR